MEEKHKKSFTQPPPTYTSDKTVTENASISRPSFWAKQILVCQNKHLEKAKIQSISNPDYRVDHPAECRNNPEGKIPLECHPEAKKRILAELATKIKSVNPPPVNRPPRYNRS